METITQQPELTKNQLERRSAMQMAFDKIESIVGDDTRSITKLNVTKNFLEEVKGKDYRLEQAAAKLVEYYELEVEVENRGRELLTIFPGANIKVAANDAKFLADKDDQYLVKTA